MSDVRELIDVAARDFQSVVAAVAEAVPPQRLTDPTPCAEYDVRGLGNHLLYWAPRLAAAARKQPPPPPDGGEGAVDLMAGDWARRLSACADDLTEALRTPSAWEGVTTMGGGELPAPMVGTMVLCEFVIHGWDLAIAAGVTVRAAPETAAELEAAMRPMIEQGRQMKVFGPAVAVADTAPALDRLLALAGRDPEWAP